MYKRRGEKEPEVRGGTKHLSIKVDRGTGEQSLYERWE